MLTMKQYKFFPQDTIFSLNDEFKADPRPNKINAGIGIYLDNQGKPFVIPIISEIASKMNFKNFNLKFVYYLLFEICNLLLRLQNI